MPDRVVVPSSRALARRVGWLRAFVLLRWFDYHVLSRDDGEFTQPFTQHQLPVHGPMWFVSWLCHRPRRKEPAHA